MTSSILRNAIFIAAVGFAFTACSTKKGSPGFSDSDRKGEDEADASTNSSERPNKFYFSELQMVIETSPEAGSNCPDTKKIQMEFEDPSKVELTEEGKLKLLLGKDTFRLFSVNVRVQQMGFDTGQFSFTAIDGAFPIKTPYQMRLRRKPGNILELSYLDQKFPMVLQNTPVYNFTVREDRGGCIVNHTLNIFGEHTGYYLLEEPT